MSGPTLSALVTHALSLPPHVAALRTVRFTLRSGQHWLRRHCDRIRCTHAARGARRFDYALGIDFDDVAPAEVEALSALTAHYLRHEFDLLGSGWQDAALGAEVAGIEGVRYSAPAPTDKPAPGRDVSRANRARSAAMVNLITVDDYDAIDWQRDLRSGFRWSGATYYSDIQIGQVRGADIKWPWELGRLQHLPQLALAAGLAAHGARDLQPAAVCCAEIRAQTLDFIASNPPRFGANWACPMDVAIRAANLVLAHGLLQGAGFELDDDYQDALVGSLDAHAEHVITHVEWAERGRSNHFLADLAGLIFVCAALPLDARREAWLAYAARWLVNDVGEQFLDDGGNYEGSTGYHRLSAELVVYALAALGGLFAREPDLVERLQHSDISVFRGGDPGVVLAQAYAAAGGALGAMLEFARACRRPDGTLILVGDMDSGRAFNLAPRLEPDDEAGGTARASDVDISELLAVGGALGTTAAYRAAPLAARVARALADGWTYHAARAPHRALRAQQSLQALIDADATLPDDARRRLDVPVPGLDPAQVLVNVYPDFGLYILRSESFYLAFRCAGAAPAAAPTSHLHDDNLSIELYVGGRALIVDAGTYAYTAFPELRNRYRAAGAHFAPRAADWAAVEFTDYLFELRQLAAARCVHASSAGLAGRLESDAGHVMRVIRLRADVIEIYDSCAPGALAAPAPAIRYCCGYGRPTARLVHPF